MSFRGPTTGVVELPVFEGKVKSKSFQLSGGMAEIKVGCGGPLGTSNGQRPRLFCSVLQHFRPFLWCQDLVILENSPGTDGMEYILVFQPLVRGLPTDSVLKSFELPFMFYNGEQAKSWSGQVIFTKTSVSPPGTNILA